MTTKTTLSDIQDFLQARIAKFTGTEASQLGADSVLLDLGLQSIDAVILSGEVEDEFQTEINPSMIFEHETLGSFSQAVLDGLSTK
ncbi:acyl carrier protein [Rhodobacter sp. NTK016B]|uniref:acyl carrier protein n=1 Tax=Rhodobacter sp. NTK016B TaxID=2759676 RepID=UPI001A8FB4E7|nr:acyl carrier protein [Rhodobacter sp. NTK016B]MBN8294610.1 acyl carrier protein [Rhodobacter sp. NTK016B]